MNINELWFLDQNIIKMTHHHMFQNLQGPLIFPSPRRDCCSSSSDRGSSHVEMGWASCVLCVWVILFSSLFGCLDHFSGGLASPLSFLDPRGSQLNPEKLTGNPGATKQPLLNIVLLKFEATFVLYRFVWWAGSQTAATGFLLASLHVFWWLHPHHICATDVSGCWCHHCTWHV